MNDSTINNTKSIQYGLFIRVLRTRITIEFEDPYTQKITEELLIINDGKERVCDIPIPLPEPRNGLRVLDDDDSLLSFLPHSEILKKLMKVKNPVSDDLQSYLNDGRTIIWINLPDKKMMSKGETRVIRLNYWPANPANPQKQNSSLFSIPLYSESFAKGTNSRFDTFYLIKPPRDYIIQLKNEDTIIVNEKNEKIDVKPLVYDRVNLNNKQITVIQRESFINIRFPAMENSYKAKIAYELKLPKNEHRFWKYLVPLSLIVLASLVLATFSEVLMGILQATFPIGEDSIIALAGIVGTVAGAVIALFHNPLIIRIKLILFIDIVLVLILLINVDTFP
ncbi:hypothetical protein [Candidatus Nitrosocosmicus hydrocola]|uniref:hypothetical protein n=1 Tax=Candidatus Nitrosocosmicus hydrocola TaxID=1826872 RepID=UPI0013732DAA|nr:hypothetical protein [Candidatus Nitrosocosmicus hydrocola]